MALMTMASHFPISLCFSSEFDVKHPTIETACGQTHMGFSHKYGIGIPAIEDEFLYCMRNVRASRVRR
jgi:hypothetical protein